MSLTLKETTTILFMLSAYYGQGKSDTKLMAMAWHPILEGYDFGIAQEAVIEFAKSDMREYASFPTPGRVVDAIESRISMRNGIINMAISGYTYADLCEREPKYAALVTEKQYGYLLERRENLPQKREQAVRWLLPKGNIGNLALTEQ